MNQKKSFRYKRFYFINVLLLIFVSVSYTNANVHYVCSDSSFSIKEYHQNADQNLIKNDTGIINDRDSIFIVPGVTLTLIPDSLNNEFFWQVFDDSICVYSTYNTDTLECSSEGTYYYGSWSGAYKFACYVFIVDSSRIQFELNKILSEEDSYRLGIKPFFKEYLWSTGDTTNSIEINESGLYQIEVVDHCNNFYTKEIHVELMPDVIAGEVDTSSMIFDSLGYVIPFQNYYTGEYALDPDEDGAMDLLFEIDIDNANGYIEYEYLLTPSNGYQICVNPELHVKNIPTGDAVNNKLIWSEESQLIISHKFKEVMSIGGCHIGWWVGWNNTTIKNIGFRKEYGNSYLYGWLSLRYFVNGYITFINYAMEDIQVDIKEHPLKEVEIRPNPFPEFIIIEGEMNEGIFELFTLDGKRVFTSEIQSNNQKFDLHFLESGIYIGSILTKDNTYTIKVIKSAM